MKQSSFIQLAISFITLIMSVECSPAPARVKSTTSSGTNPAGASNSLMQTLGKSQEDNCRGNSMSWTTSQQDSWQKLTLAENLNLYNNVWQKNLVQSPGKSEITCISFNKGVLSWRTNFYMPCSPQNNNQVKAYTNVAWAGKPVPIKDAKIFNSTWDWKLLDLSPDTVADVSYDIFLTKDPNCRSQDCASREVMVWLAAIGKARPAGSRSPVNGNPTGTITIGRKYEFQVYQGTVNVPVISIFPAEEGRKFTSFKGDLKNLLKSLSAFGVGQDEYILSVGAGIEVFKGKGTLDTPRYTIDLY